MECQTDTLDSDTHCVQTGHVEVSHADEQISADLPAHLQDVGGPGAQCIVFTAEVVLVVIEQSFVAPSETNDFDCNNPVHTLLQSRPEMLITWAYLHYL